MNLDTALVIGMWTLWGSGFAWIWSQLKKCERHHKLTENRLTALEASLSSDAPSWRRSQDGVFITVNREFVRLFLAPCGYHANEVVGKKLSDLKKLSPKLIKVLDEMDKELLGKKNYACRHGVEISEGTTATIIKVASANIAQDVVFIGYAVPEN